LSHGKVSINLSDCVNLQNVENATKSALDLTFFEKAKNSPILSVCLLSPSRIESLGGGRGYHSEAEKRCQEIDEEQEWRVGGRH
jgi:hypothetical protein